MHVPQHPRAKPQAKCPQKPAQARLETAGGDLDLPTLCGVQAPALFYADDLDLVSTSVRGLQAQLELLESFCTRWRLTVNVKKTKEEACVRTGTLPPDWALCRITPIHKGGDATVPGNYRGIAVSTVLAKLYASLLTRRLAEWTERHHLRAVGQAGFRAAHNTADQMLVMRTLIESARAAREPLFVCFVDFRKAYDSVPRDLLWRKLQSLGVTGWCLQAIQALYAVVPLVLQGAPVGTAPFHSHLGVKQGCPLSPLLFGIYTDDLESVFASSDADLDLPTLGGRPVPPLLYADDLGLVSRSQAGLQAQMHLLRTYSGLWQIFVNVAKTRGMVFQHAASAAVPLHLTYDGSEVEVVDAFCYLGVIFHRTAPFSDAGLVRATTGQTAVLAMTRRCRELGIHDPTMRLRLFDALVRPVMLYGIEVWGPHSLGQVDAQFERVHRSFLRRLIGVREATPSAVVLAELGRYPLMVLATVQVCRYWNRLLAMDDTRLVRLAFSESVRLAALPTRSAVRAPWAAQVASLLAVTPLPATGPRHIDIKAELSALQQRYLTSVSQSALPKVQLYLGQVADALCIDSYQMASYLKEVTSRAQLRRLAQLRTGSHQLRVETGRWERPRVAREQRICQRCLSGEVDDEHHMVFDCPALEEVRVQHAGLFAGSADLRSFLAQESSQVAAFVSAGFDAVLGD